MNPPQDGPAGAYLSAAQAAGRLGVKLATLYAYTSRGLVRSVPSGGGPARRYLQADIERLRSRSEARSGAATPAGGALRSGEPLLDTAIAWLGDEGPVYRGRLATALAERESFESVAELLWTGELPGDPPRWSADGLGLPRRALAELLPPGTHPLAALPIAAAALGARDADRHATHAAFVLPCARQLIRRLTAALALTAAPARLDEALAAPSVAESLAIALAARPGRRAVRAIDRALVLLADHELNPSTFAARVAASTHADLYACLGAGFAALGGPRHGGASERVAALLAEIGRPERAAEVVRARLRRGELIPGFGHAVYRGTDPRAAPLLASALELAPRLRAVRTVEALIRAMRAARRPPANVDTALAALGPALGLPSERTPALFAVGRLAGWVAHVLEQYEGPLIRPRARYLQEA